MFWGVLRCNDRFPVNRCSMSIIIIIIIIIRMVSQSELCAAFYCTVLRLRRPHVSQPPFRFGGVASILTSVTPVHVAINTGSVKAFIST